MPEKPDPRITSRLEYMNQLCKDAAEAAVNVQDVIYGDALRQMRRVLDELLHEVPLPSTGVNQRAE